MPADDTNQEISSFALSPPTLQHESQSHGGGESQIRRDIIILLEFRNFLGLIIITDGNRNFSSPNNYYLEFPGSQ
jgi:hypothetical protein